MRGAKWKQSEGGWATQNSKAFFATGLLGHLLSWHHRSPQEGITVDDHRAFSLWRPCRCVWLVECTRGNSEDAEDDNLQSFPWLPWVEGGNLGNASPGVLWEVMGMWGQPASVAPSHFILLSQVSCGPYLQCPSVFVILLSSGHEEDLT